MKHIDTTITLGLPKWLLKLVKERVLKLNQLGGHSYTVTGFIRDAVVEKLNRDK